MRRLLTSLRAGAAACLLLAAAAAQAAPPEANDPLASLQSAYLRAVPPGAQADFYRDLLATVLQRVERSYATEVDLNAFAAAAIKVLEPLPAAAGEPRELFSSAINTALRTLDPYSRYLDPRARANEREGVTGAFSGLGLEVEASNGAVRVVAPIPDSPASRAGLLAGDLIVRVDQQPLQGVALADAIAKMRGAPGTPVAVTIRRAGLADEFTVSLTRDTIRRQALRWNMEGDVLVLRLSTFSGPVAAAVQQAIAEATAAHAPRALVFDLRGNPGGLLREAVTIADAFLAKGDIVSLRGRSPGNQRTWRADADELLAGAPMVVLVDRRSASASELVAAALQDNGRAVVMGQRSFGKGTVQSTYGLGDEARGGLKLTSAHYHSPSGRSVQKTGVGPDIELLAASEDSRPGAEGNDAAPAPRARVEQARCAAVYKAADPALSCAVAYLQSASVEAFVAGVAQQRP
jgi:carboxyl-terminal processing protease